MVGKFDYGDLLHDERQFGLYPPKRIRLFESREEKSLYLFKKREDLSFKKMVKWLENYNLSYQIITVTTINKAIIKKMLCNSENGFDEILVSEFKSAKIWRPELKRKVDSLTVEDMISEIKKNPYLLKSPILFDEEKLLAGYNGDEIRKFVPKLYRVVKKNNRGINKPNEGLL